MRIGQLSQATGVSTRSLRHYEQQGLLKPQRHSNGYREYPDAAVAKIQRIQWLLSAGLTTKTIRRMLPCVLEEGPPVVQCPELRRDLAQEISRLTERIETLRRSRKLLQRALGTQSLKTPLRRETEVR